MLPFAAMLAVAIQATAQDWPRFRGPNGSGVTTATHLPASFGPGKNLAWKVDAPPGHSSPVIIGPTVYLTGFEDKALLVIAYDRDSGKQLWVRKIARERQGKKHDLNNAASPTPVADRSGVIAYFQD